MNSALVFSTKTLSKWLIVATITACGKLGADISMIRPSSSSRIKPSWSGSSKKLLDSQQCLRCHGALSHPSYQRANTYAVGRNDRRRKLLATTETLEKANAAEARIGDSSHPVQG